MAVANEDMIDDVPVCNRRQPRSWIFGEWVEAQAVYTNQQDLGNISRPVVSMDNQGIPIGAKNMLHMSPKNRAKSLL